MKYVGIRSNTTPIDTTPGVAQELYNPRLRVDGELRRRRGMARSNQAKLSAAVRLVNGFALGQGQPFMVMGTSSGIEGTEAPEALWGDAQLRPVTGETSPYSGTEFDIEVTRGDNYATSAVIFAKSGSYPSDLDPGTYVGTVSFGAASSAASTTWTAPSSGTWYFRAYPVRKSAVGPGANLTRSDVIIDANWFCDTYWYTDTQSGATLTFSPLDAAYWGEIPTPPLGRFYQLQIGQAYVDGHISSFPYVMQVLAGEDDGGVVSSRIWANFYEGGSSGSTTVEKTLSAGTHTTGTLLATLTFYGNGNVTIA